MVMDVSIGNYLSENVYLTKSFFIIDTSPNGLLYKEVNSTITIVCTIDLNNPKSEGLNSSYLSFKFNTGEPKENEVQVIENKFYSN